MYQLNVQRGQALADAGSADAGAVMRFETGLMVVAENQAAGRVHVGIASLVFGQHSAALVRAAVVDRVELAPLVEHGDQPVVHKLQRGDVMRALDRLIADNYEQADG